MLPPKPVISHPTRTVWVLTYTTPRGANDTHVFSTREKAEAYLIKVSRDVRGTMTSSIINYIVDRVEA